MTEKTVVLHLKLEQGELAMETAGNSAKSVQNDREKGQQGALPGLVVAWTER